MSHSITTTVERFGDHSTIHTSQLGRWWRCECGSSSQRMDYGYQAVRKALLNHLNRDCHIRKMLVSGSE